MGDGNTREEVVRLTQELVALGNQVKAAFVAVHGTHGTDVEALTVVLLAAQQGRPMTAGVLAGHLAVTSGAVTAVVDRLERAGYLTRVRDDRDRRKVLLECTTGGEELAARYLGPVRERSDAVMEHFSAEELRVVRRFLGATNVALAAHRRELRQPPSKGQRGDAPLGRTAGG